MKLTGMKFWVPYMRLIEEGAEVTTVGPEADADYRGKHGLPAHSEVRSDEVNPGDYAAVVIPGGWAPDQLRRHESVKRLVREVYARGDIVAMICHAGLVGISAGIVAGHQAIGSEGIKDDLINAGATWRDEPAFTSRNIVWGRVVADIPDFCRELIAALAQQDLRQKTGKQVAEK
jgi:protease I